MDVKNQPNLTRFFKVIGIYLGATFYADTVSCDYCTMDAMYMQMVFVICDVF